MVTFSRLIISVNIRMGEVVHIAVHITLDYSALLIIAVLFYKKVKVKLIVKPGKG